MNVVRRLLNLLLCLMLALNGVAIVHAGAASAHAHGATAGAAAADMPDGAPVDNGLPCHEASDAAPLATAAMPADVPDAPCCNDDAAVCDHACMTAAASAALVSDRAVPAAERLRSDVPSLALHARPPPRALPPIRPPIG